MKKSILILSAAVSLLAYQAFGQTIAVNGTSASGNAGQTFTLTLSLSITGANSIGDVESVNMLLRTLNGASFFTLSNVTPISPFSNTNAPPSTTSTFGTTGDAANSGFTVTTNTNSGEVGSNAPAGSNPVAGTGTTSFNFETVNFNSLGSTPAGVYHFGVTLGGHPDAQGSWIDNSANTTFDINSAPDFTITIVPEPATWSLFGLGVVGAFGLNLLRTRRTIS
jgi:hypothetical protein